MRKLTGLMGAAVALAVLSGCTAYDRAES
ncbi:MAG TPA: transcriptional regulator, partial [Erwinia persicina]|nr:transcriptional regulator [Erwinia persicina]